MEAIKEGLEEPRRITTAEWLQEGRDRFGVDPKLWQFVCANCGNVQTIADFIKLREFGIDVKDAQVAYFSCIGRFDTRIALKDVGIIEANPKSPCNYTLGGLFRFAKTIVMDDEGKENPVFEFAEE